MRRRWERWRWTWSRTRDVARVPNRIELAVHEDPQAIAEHLRLLHRVRRQDDRLQRVRSGRWVGAVSLHSRSTAGLTAMHLTHIHS